MMVYTYNINHFISRINLYPLNKFHDLFNCLPMRKPHNSPCELLFDKKGVATFAHKKKAKNAKLKINPFANTFDVVLFPCII